VATQTAVDELAELHAAQGRYVPTVIDADISRLSPADREVLRRVLVAGQAVDEIFLRQAWSGNVALRDRLRGETDAVGRARYRYFQTNGGPWSQVDGDAAFIPGVPVERPAGANVYPEDMTKEEFEGWVETLSPIDRDDATGFFHTIRRGKDGLMPVPYSVEYRELLNHAALALYEAASLTDDPSLREFLNLRSNAFIFNHYFHSDCAWVDLDGSLEITIGPYETYGDRLLGLKAFFEAFVTVVDPVATAKVAQYAGYAQELEDNLPIDSAYRNPKVMGIPPMRVADVVANFGEASGVVQPTAFFLPNDPRVIEFKGSKQVLLQNVQHAKFDQILVPIAKTLLVRSSIRYVTFEAFFSHTQWHEVSHGLGRQRITVNGRQTTVQQELKELNMTIEEAKADIAGLWAPQYLMNRGFLDAGQERALYTTYLADTFRGMRRGLEEAHGRALALEFNFISERGGFVQTERGFAVNVERTKAAVTELATTLLTLQAQGNYQGAKSLLDRYARLTPELSEALGRLSKVPVDIAPTYATANQLLAVPNGGPVSARRGSVSVLG
jgi:hypothetical protein